MRACASEWRQEGGRDEQERNEGLLPWAIETREMTRRGKGPRVSQ